MNIAESLDKALKILEKSASRRPREDAKMLLRHVLQRDKAFLMAHDTDYFLTEAERQTFFDLIEKRAQNLPIQHLTGRQEFYGRDFEVSKDVLIPRPETEFLVEAALEILPENTAAHFCDVGAGSGAICVSILAERPQSRAVALDISAKSLAVTRRNAEKYDVINRLRLFESNVFEVLRNFQNEQNSAKEFFQFDAIVSNPPYIPLGEAAELDSEVVYFEPHTALFSGADGFDVIKILLADAPFFLKPHGSLIFEIGYGQAAKIPSLIDEKVWQIIEIRADLQNIPRIVHLKTF